MKKGAIASIGLLVIIFYINGCGIINRGSDPGSANAPSGFSVPRHQQDEGFGFWNQQKDSKNPIANMVTRDERPGRGMNGIVDQHPNRMKRRISRFETNGDQRQAVPNSRSYDNNDNSDLEGSNITEQISLELVKRDTVRDARILTYKNELLIAISSDAKDTKALKAEITNYLSNNFPTKKITVVTDLKTIDRFHLLDNSFRKGRSNEDDGIQLREIINEVNEAVED